MNTTLFIMVTSIGGQLGIRQAVFVINIERKIMGKRIKLIDFILLFSMVFFISRRVLYI